MLIFRLVCDIFLGILVKSLVIIHFMWVFVGCSCVALIQKEEASFSLNFAKKTRLANKPG
jgi:hypothetical protein